MVRALLRRGLAVLHRHQQRRSTNIGFNWATVNYCCNNNTGNLTLTNNWYDGGGTNIRPDHGAHNTVSGNIQVSNGELALGRPVGHRLRRNPARRWRRPAEVMIVGAQSGRCVDVPGSSTTNGTQLQLWDCHGGANQRWTYTAEQAADGVRQQVPGRQRAGHGQRHRRRSSGTATGRPTSSGTSTPTAPSPASNPGMCLDANGAGTANGTKIILWDCNGGANQRWSFRS